MLDTILESFWFNVVIVVYVNQCVNEFHKYHTWSGKYEKNGKWERDLNNRSKLISVMLICFVWHLRQHM